MGSPQALERLLQPHLEWLRSYIRRRTGALLQHKADTGDYAQETIIELLLYEPLVTPSNSQQLRALLAKIADNVLCREHARWRTQRRDPCKEVSSTLASQHSVDAMATHGESPCEHAIRDEGVTLMRRALGRLRRTDLETITLRDYHLLSFADIGSRLGTTAVNARQRYLRAVDRLTTLLVHLRRTVPMPVLADVDMEPLAPSRAGSGGRDSAGTSTT